MICANISNPISSGSQKKDVAEKIEGKYFNGILGNVIKTYFRI